MIYPRAKKVNMAILLFGIMLLIACKDGIETADRLVCDVGNPLEDLDWLKQIKKNMVINQNMAGSEIIQYNYQGEIVFWIDVCHNCPDNMIQVFNCEGELICQFGGIAGFNTCPDFLENVMDKEVLYTSIE